MSDKVTLTTWELWCAAPEIGSTWDMIYRSWTPGAVHQYMVECKEADRLQGVTMIYDIRTIETDVSDNGSDNVKPASVAR